MSRGVDSAQADWHRSGNNADGDRSHQEGGLGDSQALSGVPEATYPTTHSIFPRLTLLERTNETDKSGSVARAEHYSAGKSLPAAAVSAHGLRSLARSFCRLLTANRALGPSPPWGQTRGFKGSRLGEQIFRELSAVLLAIQVKNGQQITT